MKNPIVTLLGYRKPSHTHYWPQLRFYEVFRQAGLDVEWTNLNRLRSTKRPRVFITWNEPPSTTLVEKGIYDAARGDVILQKLTSLGAGDEAVNWGTDAHQFFRDWTWNTYRRVEDLFDDGVNIHGFGARTVTEPFPEKHRICQKLGVGDRIHWMSWGPCLYSENELQRMRPVMSGFRYDLGWVGGRWGVVGRGNIDSWDAFMNPLISRFPNNAIAGSGNPMGAVSNRTHKKLLRRSRLCPVVHSPSWIVEQGCQDRTYSVFASGRFGVIDNPGIYHFFDENEVVCETDPDEYFEKSVWFAENPDAQLPYIETFQERIRSELNLRVQWMRILDKVLDHS